MAIKFLNSLNADSGVLYVDADNNRVGIGTTNPNDILVVSNGSGEVRFGGGNGRTLSAYANGNLSNFDFYANQTYFNSDFLIAPGKKISTSNGSTDNLYLTTTNAAKAIYTDRSIGIGTTSPSVKLDVIGVGVFGTMTSSRSTYSNGLSLQNNTGEATSLFLWQSGVASAHIGSPANSTSLHIVNSYNTGLITDPNSIVLTNTGNVGIGTTSPVGRLEVVTTDANRYIRFKAPNGEERFQFYTGGTGNPATQHMYNADGTTKNVQIAAGGTSYFNGGNVGIGTTSPSHKLQVAGNIYANAGQIYIDNGYYLSGGDATSRIYLGNNGSQGVQIYTNSTERMRIADGGNVGIGTTTPSEKLDVSGRVQAERFRTTTGGNATFAAYYFLGDADTGTFQPANNTFGITTAGSERLRIDAAGRVGIGVTAMSTELQVSGTTTSDTFQSFNGGHLRVLNPEGAAADLGASVTGAIKITLPQSWTNTMMSFTVKVFDYAGGESFDVRIHGYNYSGGDGYWVNTAAYITSQANVDRNFSVRFGHDGTKCCVIIGETTSTWAYLKVAVLDFQGTHSDYNQTQWNDGWAITSITTLPSNIDSNVSNTQIANWKRNGQNVYYGSGTGNVGIGTTGPTYKLDVETSDDIVASFVSTDNKAAIRINDNDTSVYVSAENSKASFGFNVGVNAGNLNVDTLGYVGIGTASPVAPLHISDTSSSNLLVKLRVQNDLNHAEFGTQSGYARILSGGSLLYAGSSNATYFYYAGSTLMSLASNNVGIGTTSPGYKLDVSGTIRATENIIATGHVDANQLYVADKILHSGDTDTYLGFENNRIKLFTGGSQRLELDNGGTLKIGDSANNTYGLRFQRENGGVPQDSHFYSPSNNSPSAFFIEGGYWTGEATGQVTAANNGYAYYERYFGNGTSLSYKHLGFVRQSSSAFTGTDLSPSIVMLSNGNVGIGTTSPNQKLTVNGTIRGTGSTSRLTLDNTSGQAFQIYAWGSGTNIYNSATSNADIWFGRDAVVANNFYFTRNGTNHTMKIDTNAERVGIGTTSPSEKLHVVGNVRIEGDLTVNGSYTQIDTDVNTTEQWNVTNDGTGPAVTINQTGAQDIMDVQDDGTSVFYIEDGGDVGIGTTSPSSRLNVVSTTNDPAALTVQDDARKIKIGRDQIHVTDLSDNGAVMYLQSNANLVIANTSGNVGIGKQPSFKLDVNGTGRFTGNLHTESRIGIGTSTPTEKLSVFGKLLITTSQGALDNGYFTKITSGYSANPFILESRLGVLMQAEDYGNSLSLHSGNAERVRINGANGNVGIGTTSPSEKLHVNGNIKANGSIGVTNIVTNRIVKFNGSVLDDSLLYDNGTSIGLGTNSPNAWAQLETSGTVAVGGILYIKSSQKIQGLTGFPGSAGNLSINPDGGNVGIGATAPDHALHIKSSATGNATNLKIESTSQYGGLALFENTASRGTLAFGNDGNIFTGALSDSLSLRAEEALHLGAGGNNLSMTIATSGNVGIGTTSPSAKLHVSGSRSNLNGILIGENSNQIQFSTAANIVWGNGDSLSLIKGSTTALYIASSTRVGIGTTSPSRKLHLSDSSSPYQIALQSDTSTVWQMGVGMAGYYQNWFILNNGSSDLIRMHSGYTNLRNSLWIDSSNNSTTLSTGGTALKLANPDTTVNNISAIDFPQTSGGSGFSRIGVIYKDRTASSEDQDMFFRTIGGGSSAEVMRLTSAGNVGIGTSSPSEKLEVSGNIKATKLLLNTANNGYTLYSNGESRINDVVFASGGGADYIQKSSGTGTFYVRNNLAGKVAYFGANNTSSQFTNYVAVNGGANSVAIRTNDSERLTVNGSGNVGIGTTSPLVKLDVNGTVKAGGKTTYTKAQGSLDTTGFAVAGLLASGNGNSANFIFNMHGGAGHYQKVVYSCYNASGTWFAKKVIDEGTNYLDVEASANGATITFTFKSRTGIQYYTPHVTVEHVGSAIDTQYL